MYVCLVSEDDPYVCLVRVLKCSESGPGVRRLVGPGFDRVPCGSEMVYVCFGFWDDAAYVV